LYQSNNDAFYDLYRQIGNDPLLFWPIKDRKTGGSVELSFKQQYG
jgi:hypothetical protein